MVTIVLPPDLEQSISERARRNGTTPELLVIEALHHEFSQPVTPAANDGTLADFLGQFNGCIDSGEIVPGGARMSEQISEKFAAGMVKKHKAGKL